jgi:flagellin
MGQVINTNSLSLLTQNNLNRSQSALNSAIERLSSGMRINSAKDDAAGQAIANRFTANIKGLTQAQRNANDGISLAQTTEGALNEVNNNLQRIRELSVQAANGSNSAVDKASIQAEITQRLDEIDRTSAQTDFNGVKVLSADSGLSFQVGANDGETISINLKKIDREMLGLTGFNVDGATSVANAAATADDLTLDGFVQGAVQANGSVAYAKTVTTNNTAATAADALADVADTETVTYAGTDTGYGAASVGAYTYASATDSFSFTVADATAANIAAKLTPATGGSTAATVTIGANAAQHVFIDSSGNITAADDSAVLYLTAAGDLTKTNSGGLVQATATSLATAMSTGTAAGSIVTDSATMTIDTVSNAFDVSATISASAFGALAATNGNFATSGGYTATGGVVTVTAGGAPAYTDADGAMTAAATTVDITTYYAQTTGMVTDDTGAQVYKDDGGALTLEASTLAETTADPLAAIDAALSTVDNLRGALGAVQNRFDSVISNLGTTINNLSSSRSRIEDADYATEVSNMSRAQILQQAGTSVLAQANQTTQGVLSLLR